ncbi:MAG: hypothetical protein OXG46_05880 [Chloroflexi bacterium]|nr:hypothetical protein [Chloroflexota bacterium]MCY3937871.1 hypothetical protein [Chloroflexota bacterium]
MIERSQFIQVAMPPLRWNVRGTGFALPRPEKLAGMIVLAHGSSQLVLMATFHGWHGFALAMVAIEAAIGVALLAGSTAAASWLRFWIAASFLLFAPAILFMGDFAGLAAMLALWAGQYALVTPEFREMLKTGGSAGLACGGLAGGFGLCVAEGLGAYTPPGLV